MRLDAIVRCHEFMRIERPPVIWEADTEDYLVLPLLGEIIAAALSRGAVLGELTLNVANVEVGEDADAGVARPIAPARGAYVAVTVSGSSDLGPDARWLPGTGTSVGLLERLDARLLSARACFAYCRHLASGGSVTVYFARMDGGAAIRAG